MRTDLAFVLGELNRGKEQKVFDWNKAVELILANNIKNATAGLEEDMEWTSGTILKDGNPYTEDYTFLASTWATPILVDEDTGEEYYCYIKKSQTKFNSHTKWPKEALDLFTHK